MTVKKTRLENPLKSVGKNAGVENLQSQVVAPLIVLGDSSSN